jgi:uncharacterized protein YggE
MKEFVQMFGIKSEKIIKVMLPVLLILTLVACAKTESLSPNPYSTDILRDTIYVTGTGMSTGVPDIARVELGVETEDEDLGAAVDATNRKMMDLTTALTNLGIAEDDLLTTQYNIRQENQIDPETGRTTDTGNYVVSSTLRVTVRDIDQISHVIETGLDSGANRVFGLSFDIEDTTELESEARAKAIQDAMDKAQDLAEGLSVTLGNPVYISEGFGNVQPITKEQAAPAMGGGPSISTGQLTVSVQVNVIFTIE